MACKGYERIAQNIRSYNFPKQKTGVIRVGLFPTLFGHEEILFPKHCLLRIPQTHKALFPGLRRLQKVLLGKCFLKSEKSKIQLHFLMWPQLKISLQKCSKDSSFLFYQIVPSSWSVSNEPVNQFSTSRANVKVIQHKYNYHNLLAFNCSASILFQS